MMKRALKLSLYYYGYQLLFTALLVFPMNLAKVFQNGEATTSMNTETNVDLNYITGIAMVLSGIMMIWHLIHFKYVKFNWRSFTEVPAKTIWLSIPLILGAMTFFNICSEIIALPNWMEDEFLGMSRNIFRSTFRRHHGSIGGRTAVPRCHRRKQAISTMKCLLISSLIFGIVHINPAQVPFAFAIGAVFGWLYYRTGSVVPGIIGHFINNSIATIQMMVLSKEELNTKTVDMIGEGPTYALFAASFALMIGSFLYLKKHLPAAPEYKEEQELTI